MLARARSQAGFTTIERSDVQITTGVTLTLNADMRLGGVQETITVSGETPVVDVQNSTRVQRVLSDEVLAPLPASRAPSTCQTGASPARPCSATGPRSRQSKCALASRCVRGQINTAPGSASACRRAARFGASPMTVCSVWVSLPRSSPTMTVPVAMPMRACNAAPAPANS